MDTERNEYPGAADLIEVWGGHVSVTGHSKAQTYHLLYYFVIYSFIGWIIETIYILAKQGKFVSRGLMDSPFCPLYGFGVLLLLLLLDPLRSNRIAFFTAATVLCTLLEYITGSILRVAFKRTFWDYSHEALNINGLVCLKISLLWGAGALLVIYGIHPFVHWLVDLIPTVHRAGLSCFVILYFLIGAAGFVTTMLGIQTSFGLLGSAVLELLLQFRSLGLIRNMLYLYTH